MILTDAKGKPLEKPKREDFKDSTEFLRAMNEYNDRLRKAGSEGFDEGFRAGMKPKKKGEAPAREPDDEETRKRKVADMMKRWAVKGR